MSIYEYDEEKRIQKERQDAREEGREDGREAERILLMIKKMQKDKTLKIIANELECEPEEIYDLYQAIEECGVECEVQEILEALAEKRKLILI